MNKEKNLEVKLLEEISKKLDILTFTIACQGKSEEQINNIVASSDLTYKEAAPILGITSAALQKRIERMKKKKKSNG